MVKRACVVKGGMSGEGGHAWQSGACILKGGLAWDTMRYDQ